MRNGKSQISNNKSALPRHPSRIKSLIFHSQSFFLDRFANRLAFGDRALCYLRRLSVANPGTQRRHKRNAVFNIPFTPLLVRGDALDATLSQDRQRVGQQRQ